MYAAKFFAGLSTASIFCCDTFDTAPQF